MDVLARLATEDPDLSGLPAELTPLITACLQRVPRMRPTSSAMLSRLGQFTETLAGPDEEHSYLPEPAMALIGAYQRNPQLAAHGLPSEELGEDATAASYTELPASYKPVPRRKPEPGQPRRGVRGWLWLPWRPLPRRRGWIRTHLAWAGWACVGAALIAVGVILGASLSGSSAPRSTQDSSLPPGPPPPPPTVCGSKASSGPALCMENRSQGDAGAAFVVRGSGFAPRASLTVTLNEVGPPPTFDHLVNITSSFRPVTGADGMFTVTIRQLYSGSLQPGLFTVTATGSGGRTAQTWFMVIPSRPPPGA
jgi:hypothetical protein